MISSAGLYNTFERLLKPEISQKSYFSDICRQLKPGIAAMNVFLGFNASNEELNLKAHNIWAFPTNDSEKGFMEYLDLSVEEALDAKVPLMFVSFPSAKDPNWWVEIWNSKQRRLQMGFDFCTDVFKGVPPVLLHW